MESDEVKEAARDAVDVTDRLDSAAIAEESWVVSAAICVDKDASTPVTMLVSVTTPSLCTRARLASCANALLLSALSRLACVNTALEAEMPMLVSAARARLVSCDKRLENELDDRIEDVLRDWSAP